MTKNILNDVSILSSIPIKNINKFVNILELAIVENVYQCINEQESICELNIGFGTLLIQLEENNLKFKFIPSAKFEEELKQTIHENTSLLSDILEKSLTSKLLDLYKELI